MSEILLFSRLMSSLVSARTFWLSSCIKIPTCINTSLIIAAVFMEPITTCSHLQSAFELFQLSLHFLYEEQQKHWSFSLKLMVNLKNNHINRKFKTGTMFSDRRLANSVFSRITMSFLMESRWAMSCWTAISLQPQTSRMWAPLSLQCVEKLEETASNLVGFGYHVFINNIHVGCGQSNQSWNDQLCLTLRKTCDKDKQQSHVSKNVSL